VCLPDRISPYIQDVLIVVNRRDPDHPQTEEMDRKTECAAVIGIERVLRQELAAGTKFGQLARLIGVGIAAVAVGDQHVAGRREREIQRTVEGVGSCVTRVPVTALALRPLAP